MKQLHRVCFFDKAAYYCDGKLLYYGNNTVELFRSIGYELVFDIPLPIDSKMHPEKEFVVNATGDWVPPTRESEMKKQYNTYRKRILEEKIKLAETVLMMSREELNSLNSGETNG